MKYIRIAVALLGVSASNLALSSSNQISGHIFRISYEPTGAFFSLQDNAGEIITYNTENCGKDNVFHLPSDHLNYKVMSAMLYSRHINNQSLLFTLSGCRYQTPVVAAVEKTLN